MDTVRQDQDDHLPWWLALYFTPGAGAKTFQRIQQYWGSPKAVIENPACAQGLLNSQLLQKIARPDWKQVDKHLAWAQLADQCILTFFDSGYPSQLKQIPNPPPVLFVQGNPRLLQHFQLAMVGSRNPSVAGRETAYQFAYELKQAGLCITSGLALGIDAASHLGALAHAPNPATIAVIGTGPDQIYPHRNRHLARDIRKHGAIVTEFPLGSTASRTNFPRRNRIISGLSLGTLVVEASLNSGSLITARYANEQGREVFAIPASIREPRASGCHHLIKGGAKLVETSEDILEELTHVFTPAAFSPLTNPIADTETSADNLSGLDMQAIELLENIGYEPTSIDQLINRSGLTAERVSSMLLVLELQGFVMSSDGNYIRLK